jgi:hypothetical protein
MRATSLVLVLALCLDGCAVSGAARAGEREPARELGGAGDAGNLAATFLVLPAAVMVVGAASLTLDVVILPVSCGCFHEPFGITRGLIDLGARLTHDEPGTPR